MIYLSEKIVNPTDNLYKVTFPIIKNYRLLYMQRSQGEKVEIIRSHKIYSVVPDPFLVVDAAKSLMIPILSNIEEKVTANIYETPGTFTSVITAIYAEKDEIKNYDNLGLKAYTDEPDYINIDQPTMIEIYKNKTTKQQNIWGISIVGRGIKEFTITINKEKIASDAVMTYNGPFGTNFIPMIIINKTLLTNETIQINFTLAASGGGAVATGFVWITDKPRIEINLPYLNQNVNQTLQTKPPYPIILPIIKPTPPPPPQPLPTNLPPYPILPNQQNLLIPSIPKPISIVATPLHETPDNPIPAILNLPDEQKTVEVLPSPFGAVRKSADAQGRMRMTNSGINYNAGTLSTTDTNAHVVWTGYGTKDVHLHAKTGSFTVQILTLYDWLAGKTIADEDNLTIDEAEVLEMNIEAREIQITAIAATTSEIKWEVTTCV